MLEEVVVTNLGLIPEATLTPAQGLTVITGETGAGKTVMLGALRLLVGEQAVKGLIGPHGDTADVSARFIGSQELVVRRVVSPDRSKAYLDGAISTASALRENIGPRVSIVGQHDQHTITSSAGVRALIDRSFTDVERQAWDAYQAAWLQFEAVSAEADLLGSDHRGLTRELETVRFQINEIDEAGFSIGDDEALHAEVSKLRNAESLISSVDAALGRLGEDGAIAHIEEASRALASAAGIDPSLGDLVAQIDDALTDLSEITTETARYGAELAVEPAHLQRAEERVALLSTLKRKYGDSLESILDFHKDAVNRESELASLLDSAEDIAERLASSAKNVEARGRELRDSRSAAGQRIARQTEIHLKDLGFSHPITELSVSTAPPSRTGADTVAVVFASDASLTPGPVGSIASGGELSRLVLALTLASGGAEGELVAFDEIDAGVGGETALAMGEKLAALARGRQVLCVTHLPQVAAFADCHYVVSRDGATATIAEATEDQRPAELSRMLAGLTSSEKGREHAEELLQIAEMTRATADS